MATLLSTLEGRCCRAQALAERTGWPPGTAGDPRAPPASGLWGQSRPPSLNGFHVEMPCPSDLILALGVLAQGLPVSRHTKVPWRQLFRKPSVW